MPYQVRKTLDSVRRDTLSDCAKSLGFSPCSISLHIWATCCPDSNGLRPILPLVVLSLLSAPSSRVLAEVMEITDQPTLIRIGSSGCPISRTRMLCISSTLISTYSTTLP